jgi:CRISPR-associated endonuclease/helicase Cas3
MSAFSLALDDFPACFAAIHGHPPYRWQMRLLEEVVASGRWPDTIAAPTGAGKTAVLDIALFHLALEADRARRAAPMRIVLAVDRRIIVDQAFERAAKIRDALANAMGGDTPLGHLAMRLAGLSGDAALHVAELRGGIPRESDWARRPDQPTILCTTVDQLGSRLLFRGYGVSAGMAPVHAGLLGMDALLILDEAHLAGAFADTLDVIRERRLAPEALALPWGWSALTATPRQNRTGKAQRFALTPDERGEEAIRRRLEARKPVRLVETSARDGAAQADALADQARALMTQLAARREAEHRAGPVVATVVNRVAQARAVFDRLKVDEGVDAILLTGRVRPAERDGLIAAYRARLEGRSNPGDRPLHVVATQCIEAGADFSVDGMVSQIAPLSALRQRFGRLARVGERDGPAPGVIVATRAEVANKADDPLYGASQRMTWSWLQANATAEASPGERNPAPVIDFGPDALDRLIAAQAPAPAPLAADCELPALPAPLLRQADIAAFAMTAPRPFPDPEPSLFLHGAFRPQTDVSLIWRADLEELFAEARKAPSGDTQALIAESLVAIVSVLPPRAAEALAMPAWRVKRQLADRSTASSAATPDSLADIDAAAADVAAPGPDESHTDDQSLPRLVLRWRGHDTDQPELITPEKIAPGDVIILPASDGGCDRFGWAPDSDDPVPDVAELAAAPYEGRQAALRLHQALWSSDGGAAAWSEVSEAIASATDARNLAKQLPALCPAREASLRRWATAPELEVLKPYGAEEADGIILLAPRGLAESEARPGKTPDAPPATEDDLGSQGHAPERLDAHSEAVARHAECHAKRLGLPERLARSLEASARWHDTGKADPRFQAFLCAVGRLDEKGGPYAKSGRAMSPAESAKARWDARLPARWRHEVQSVRHAAAMLRTNQMPNVDPDLVLWLIGTHHGQGRPFFAHDDDWDAHDDWLLGVALPAAPGPDKLDFDWQGRDWAGLMAELQARYGVWGLAFLEAVLRLADHRASAEGSS